MPPRRWPSTRTFTPASGCFLSSVTRPVNLPVVPAKAGRAIANAIAAAIDRRPQRVERGIPGSPFGYEKTRLGPATGAGTSGSGPDPDGSAYEDLGEGAGTARCMTEPPSPRCVSAGNALP